MSRSNPLDPHQLAAIQRAYQHFKQASSEETRGFYFAHAPGTGKTLSAITLLRLCGFQRTLVITNVAGLGVWKRELDHWWGEGNWQELLLEDPLYLNRPVALVTYDALKESAWRRGRILAWKPELVVLDEAHKIKSPSSQRSKAVRKIVSHIPYRLLMSGTPAHSPLDWWAQFGYIDPQNSRWSQRFTQYRDQIAVKGGPEGNWITGFSPGARQAALKEMRPFVHIATDKVLNLPEPRAQIIPVTMSPREQEAYHRLQKELVYLSEHGATSIANPMHKPMRLQQVTSGWLTTDPEDDRGERKLVELGASKLEVLLDLLDERSKEKVIISAYFTHDIERIEDLVLVSGRSVQRITGATPAARRSRLEWEFQHLPDPEILVVQQQAGGESMTLTASRCLILYSLAPSVIALQQVIGRIHRKGQLRPTQVLVLAGSKNDEALWRGLRQGLEGVSLASMLVEQAKQELNGAAHAV